MMFFFFKQKTAYEMRISDWSSDVCSSDLLVGPDGAGKTTLMRIMTGLLEPNAGHVTVAGFDVVADNDAIHAATGYMPQRFGLYEDLSVMENMRLYARLRGMDAESHGELFAELLEFTRLAPFTARLRSEKQTSELQ